MIEVFLFIFRYKIKKNGENLSNRCREFFLLSKDSQRRVLDIYFKHLDGDFDVGACFTSKNASYYDDCREVTFFDSAYFCRKLVEFNVKYLYLIDRFGISYDKKNYLIDRAIDVIKRDNLKFSIDDFLVYPNNLPESLSISVNFMRYVVDIDIYNIKYITYNVRALEEQREFIREVIENLDKYEFSIEKFYLNDKTPSDVLINNIDFIVYMIKNDISNVKYLNGKILNSLTSTDIRKSIDAIMLSLDKGGSIDSLFFDSELGGYLSRDLMFIKYIINRDVDNVKYVDWHNIVSRDIKDIINSLALKLVRDKNDIFDYNKYSFRDIFRQNYMFMAYMIDRDRKNIRDVLVVDKDEINKIVDIYLNKYRKCPFDRNDYLDDYGYVKDIFVSNKYMLSYLIKNDNKIFECIDFFALSDSKEVVEVMLKEMNRKSFEFCNDCFLRDGKYPVVLSNNYRFMREVIDRNFNNLAYMDISMIGVKNLKRIINYAFRLVYYIRGNNKNLSFDIDGYFIDSDIYHNDYFQECLRSL